MHCLPRPGRTTTVFRWTMFAGNAPHVKVCITKAPSAGPGSQRRKTHNNNLRRLEFWQKEMDFRVNAMTSHKIESIKRILNCFDGNESKSITKWMKIRAKRRVNGRRNQIEIKSVESVTSEYEFMKCGQVEPFTNLDVSNLTCTQRAQYTEFVQSGPSDEGDRHIDSWEINLSRSGKEINWNSAWPIVLHTHTRVGSPHQRNYFKSNAFCCFACQLIAGISISWNSWLTLRENYVKFNSVLDGWLTAVDFTPKQNKTCCSRSPLRINHWLRQRVFQIETSQLALRCLWWCYWNTPTLSERLKFAWEFVCRKWLSLQNYFGLSNTITFERKGQNG